MRKLGNFGPIDQLPRQINQLESNVDAAVRALDSKLDPYKSVPTKSVSYTAKAGDGVPFDTSQASGVVIFPMATEQNDGQRISILRLSASNTLTVLSSSGQVQGGTTDTLPTTPGVYEYICYKDRGWWRRG